MTHTWHRAIAWALVGEDVPLPVGDTPDVNRLPEQLAEMGWPADRVIARAGQAVAEGAWPFRVPADLRAGLGAAQLHAAIQAARTVYGLDVLSTRPPSRRTALTADERRLLDDVPPHY